MSSFSSTLRHFALSSLGRVLSRSLAEGCLRHQQGDGVVIWSEEVVNTLRHLDAKPVDVRGLEDQPLDDLLWAEQQRLLAAADPTAQRWHQVFERVDANRDEQSLLAFLVGCHSDFALSRTFRYAWAELSRRCPSASFLEYALQLASHRAWSVSLSEQGSLFRAGLLELELAPLPSDRGVHLPTEVCDYLLGKSLPQDQALIGFAVEEPPLRLRKHLSALSRRLAAGRPTQLAIVGARGSGRLSMAAQLARAMAPEVGLYCLSLAESLRSARLESDLLRARRIISLSGAVLALYADDLGDAEQRVFELVRRTFAGLPAVIVYLLTHENEAARVPPQNLARLSYPTRSERARAWGDAIARQGWSLPTELVSRLAGGFLLSEGQIANVIERARATLPKASSLQQHEATLLEAARTQAKTGLGALASPETCNFGLERLILDDEARTLLEELLTYARHRDSLARDWGFDELLEKGLGVTALFVGPPGTGKTLAASALARELGQELYRVELSRLVSKYIGETEKHLASLFDAAEQGEVMLLFDEADALFGKRTEVKSSVDRYANLEVNYLLQRIERFSGVVVLTTNHEKGIDDAFARRIRFRVPFDAPDAEARRKLWRALIPSAVPLAADVRLDDLADGYELSGGHIKEVLLRAASMAHAAGERLCQRYLLRSVEAEYRKLGMLSPLSGTASSNERASMFRNEVLLCAKREQQSHLSEE